MMLRSSSTNCCSNPTVIPVWHGVVLLLSFTLPAFGQPLQLDMDVFASRRADFVKQLPTHSVAIFACKPGYVRNGDVEYRYRQESNFYYLTGFQEQQSIVLLNPSAERYRYVLFVRERNPMSEAWQGGRAGTVGAMATFKADTALPFTDFQKSITSFIPGSGTLFYSFGANPRIDDMVRGLITEGPHADSWSTRDPAPLLAEMRVSKERGRLEDGISEGHRHFRASASRGAQIHQARHV